MERKEKIKNGWTGRILRMDLATGETDVLRPDPGVYETFMGGKGLAGRFLRPHVTLPWDHPDMPLLFFAGPLTGTIAPASGRSMVMSRSPLTGAVADSSVGGRLGTQLKKAGWDGIVITGRSRRPCGIEIEDERVRIVDASAFQGKGADAVFRAFYDGRRSVAAVGQAAENRVAFASVMVDRHHAAGRTGIGSCCAAKGVKYMTVLGTGRVGVRDMGELKSARDEIIRLTAASPVLMGQHGFACFGTGALFDIMDSRRMMPTDNFKKTRFEGAGKLNAHAHKKAWLPKNHGCTGCHIRCKQIADRDPMRGVAMPEFETMSHFTALIGNTDLNMVVRANDLCNRYGMDTISAAATLACYAEVSGEKNIAAKTLDLLEQMGSGSTELGRRLGKGSLAYANSEGAGYASMSVKGLELPAYDPRGAYGMSLAYATSTRGGCHLRAYPVSHEILRKPVATDRFTFSGKARIIKIAEDQNAVVDSLGVCKFIFFAAGLEEYARAYAAVTGIPATAQSLLGIGERICCNERLMNGLNGFDVHDDDLPRRFFEEPGTGGNGIEISPLDRKAFLRARDAYCRIRGLDSRGRVKPDKLKELGLS